MACFRGASGRQSGQAAADPWRQALCATVLVDLASVGQRDNPYADWVLIRMYDAWSGFAPNLPASSPRAGGWKS